MVTEQPEYCNCGSELTLTKTLTRNYHVRGEGYRVKYDKHYHCPNCLRDKVIVSNGETWNPYKGKI